MKTACTSLLAASLLLAAGARAQISDPAGDILATFAGPPNATDLDVLGASVTFTGSEFVFTGTMNGPIGSTTGGFYVWGVDRGAGTPRFGAFRPGVLFDSVVVLQTGATPSTVTALVPAPPVATPLPPGSVTFSGNTIEGRVPLALLPSLGFAPDQYTWNLWPRFAGATGNAQISDFAPDNSNALIATIPEPSSLALAGVGGLPLLLGLTRRRRRVR
jgi:hypothetical protein